MDFQGFRRYVWKLGQRYYLEVISLIARLFSYQPVSLYQAWASIWRPRAWYRADV